MLEVFRPKDIVNAREMLKHMKENGVRDIDTALSILDDHSHPPSAVPDIVRRQVKRDRVDLSAVECPSCGGRGGLRWGCLVEEVDRIVCRCGYSWIVEV